MIYAIGFFLLIFFRIFFNFTARLLNAYKNIFIKSVKKLVAEEIKTIFEYFLTFDSHDVWTFSLTDVSIVFIKFFLNMYKNFIFIAYYR